MHRGFLTSHQHSPRGEGQSSHRRTWGGQVFRPADHRIHSFCSALGVMDFSQGVLSVSQQTSRSDEFVTPLRSQNRSQGVLELTHQPFISDIKKIIFMMMENIPSANVVNVDIRLGLV